ncbi:MAG: two-component regulator propeller domain-containing protein [Vicingaceae bacterium]|nr:two-component regulator propeller domain-containing protein [Vicingaceae bacterium]
MLYLINVSVVLAQTSVVKATTPKANFTNFNTEQGLALSSISCGIIDQRGNLWFGTFGGGVSRFNGKQFTTFTTANGLANNTIWCAFEDSKGNLWFGSDGGGVSMFDGNKFITYTIKNGLPQNTILTIFEDSKGNLWLGTKEAGASKFDGKSFLNFDVSSETSQNSVWSFLEDKKGSIWMGTGGAGLLRYNGKSFVNYSIADGLSSNNIKAMVKNKQGDFWIATEQGLTIFDGNNFKTLTTQNGLPNNNISTIIIDKSENIWLGTKNQGIIKINESCYTSSKTNFSECITNFTVEEGLSHNRVFSITEDVNANLWIGTYGGGVSRYNGDAFFIYTTNQGMPQNRVWSTLEDKEGNMWFGTNDKGVCKFDGATFITYTTKDGLANNTVWAIHQDKLGNIWFGTEGGGVSKFDGKKFITYTTSKGLIHDDIRSITEDRQGNMWFGSNGGGVSKFNGEKFENYTTSNGLPFNNVRSLMSDKKGNVWLGTNGGGVSVFDGKKFANYSTKEGLSHNSIKCMLEDAVGNIWLGTSGGGAVRFDGTDFFTINTSKGLADDVVYDIVEDENGTIWFGTNLGFCGLKVTIDNKQLAPGKASLPNKTFKNAEFIWEKYNNKTGFPIKDLNTNSMFYTTVGLPKSNENTKGVIWGACGDDKIVRFNPTAIKRNKQVPKLFIQKVKINEENISWNSLKNNPDSFIIQNEEALIYGYNLDNEIKSILQKNFEGITFSEVRKWYQIPDELVLPNHLNNISFEFLAFETERNFLVKYQYALVEHNSTMDFNSVEWSPISSKTLANYNNLWEGSYIFLIKAIMPEGKRTPIQTYHFKVLPPWWRNWWMYVLYGLTLIGIMMLIVWWNGRRLAARARELTIEVQKATKEISEQKQIVEDKHKEITDSIHYAKRIQQAILPTDEMINKTLKNNFLLYLPKDVVSGDFYWLESLPLTPSEGGGISSPSGRLGGASFIAVADCTGHGVPGAMVSVVCSNALSKALLEEGITDTGKLLTRVREIVIERFAKSGGVRDGMDIALCSLKLSESSELSESYATLQYSGANRPLIIVRKGELIKIKPDKQPIGKFFEDRPFTTHDIPLQKNDMIYLFSDGYADQFGGENGKKFMTKQLYDLFAQIANKPLNVQKNILKETLIAWQGGYTQVDDICIFGVRV